MSQIASVLLSSIRGSEIKLKSKTRELGVCYLVNYGKIKAANDKSKYGYLNKARI